METEDAARRLSWDVPADASFLCHKSTVQWDTIKWTPVQQSLACTIKYIYECTLVLYPDRTFLDVG